MPRYIAFLRAINVGGHTVKMDALRHLFESFGFASVETFIASGNIIFESSRTENRAQEEQIEAGLRSTLGYEVVTFIRTDVEVARISKYQPFKQPELDIAVAFNVAFLKDALDDHANQKLMALRTDIDGFQAHGREVYWLCRKKQSESKFSNVVLENKLGIKSTIRGMETVRKLAAKLAPAEKYA
jgi:uncharacterized protein (DUF1697 family)